MIRIVDGEVHVGDKIRFMATGKEYEVFQLGVFTPFPEQREELKMGEVGFLSASIKTIGHTIIGDTITKVGNLDRTTSWLHGGKTDGIQWNLSRRQ